MSSTVPEKMPRIAIVGRPNVGKSTLLNRMCGSRVAIVEPTAGVTRDRISVPVRLPSDDGPRWVEVIDTGGVGIVDRDDLGPHVESQVNTALMAAELVLFVVDVRDGVTPLDRDVAKLLRGRDVPILLVVNKEEGLSLEWDVDAFYQLGIGEQLFGISAQNGLGLGPLYECILEHLPGALPERPEERDSMKLAVVGRRNAGKSTLINHWAREERMIVSEIPGTTRDAVDVLFDRGGETFIAIDSAGLRKPSKVADAIEFFSEARSRKTVRRADVVVLMFDVTDPVSSIEKRLARYVIDHHKPVILAANKWDLIQEGLTPEDFRDYLDKQLPGLFFAPILFLSAKLGDRADTLLTLAKELVAQAAQRVPTAELNQVLKKALEARNPSAKGYRVRLRYATQAETTPPTFVLFVNDKKLIGKDYLRYLTNRIREDLPFPEVPVRIVLRDSNDDFVPRSKS
ncbi:MAG: GTP-binding protein [Planctomycetota bacterium]|jgi:GTP-binding protein